MGKKKKSKSKKQKQKYGLAGVNEVMAHPMAQTAMKGGLVLLAAVAAGGAGAALGKHSLLAGVPVTLIGFHKKNPYLIAAGLGLTLSNGFQNKSKSTAPIQGVDGLDFKQLAEEAKDRVGTFFKNFSEKLYLSSAASGTSGLTGNDKEEQVTYFVNPYSRTKEIDMSAIDRIQEQIAGMQGSGEHSEGESLEEAEREF
jgi:hypothetical protein